MNDRANTKKYPTTVMKDQSVIRKSTLTGDLWERGGGGVT